MSGAAPATAGVEGEVLWEASAERLAASGLGAYLDALAERTGRRFATHAELWRWSVDDAPAFWASIWEHFGLGSALDGVTILDDAPMPATRWFVGAEASYAERALAVVDDDDQEAVVAVSESRPTTRLTRAELRSEVARIADGLRAAGVVRGDVVAGYLPHGAEAIVAFLAAASIGAIWTSCPPEYGVAGAVARLGQVRPKVLFGVDGYRYRGRVHHRLDDLVQLGAELAPCSVVVVRHLDPGRSPVDPPAGFTAWEDLGSADALLRCEALPFDHPLWILYSSGTTGRPKAMVHSHGGILLEHAKALSLQHDVGAGDRMLWYTTTGWMMWNLSVSGLLVGATIVAYDGDPRGEDEQVLWRLVEEEKVTRMSLGAPFLTALAQEGFRPAHDVSTLGCLGATGAPLPPKAARWVYDALPADLMLAVGSGGTDVCSAFVGPSVLLPVRAGRMAGRALGVAVEAFDDAGRAVTGEPGELVITQPLPSMPIRFWGDEDGSAYRRSYFDARPGVWTHGDRIQFEADGSCAIFGRSDATLNRGGVRLGTAELYSVLDGVAGVADSLVVHLDGDQDRLIVLVVLDGAAEVDAVTTTIRRQLAAELSPRHVPDEVVAVPSLPRTLTGKRLEVPIKRILGGAPVEEILDPTTVTEPAALQHIAEVGARLRAGTRP